ncbi:MAG: 7-carboxy-7-deazaguanine synthase QueE [Planctomycetes bacterium]|nr:7-carboxy-7-deazaguanine synthase QueE [Planctomycetota bacterium]
MTTPTTSAPLLEVFASIQGEGRFVGEAQTFLRLRGCPLRCRWCDTPNSWRLSANDRARIALSDAPPRRDPSWVTPFQAACLIAEVEPGAPRTVSVTGGEPLLWPEFVRALKAMIAPRRLHLETGGGHPRTLASVIDRCDHVSLDLKLDSDLDAPVELELPAGFDAPGITDERAPRSAEEWKRAREQCLALVSGRDACGKVVVSGGRSLQDFVPLFDEVEACAPELPLYLQPVTPRNGVKAPTATEIEAVMEAARDRDLNVRVVPQMHRAMGIP